MLRHRRNLARLALAAALATSVAGCGIKGPLTLPKAETPAKGADPAPATPPRDARSDPKL